MNLVPAQYREVSVAEVPVPLEEGALRAYLTGRDVYRRTRYVIARNGGACMLAEVSKQSEQPLFSPVTSVTVLARADETALVDAPDVDTAVPTQLARAAAEHAPGARCVIVRGRYGHVSFILDPAPVRIRVLEVVPPWPPKLVDQLSRVLDARRGPAAGRAGPRAGRPEGPGRPPPRRAVPVPLPGRPGRPRTEPPRSPTWTRSRRASRGRWSGAPAPGPSTTGSTATRCRRSTCARATWPPTGRRGGPLLTKCCLLEDRVACDGDTVVVPWGASLAQISEGLRLAVAARPVRSTVR